MMRVAFPGHVVAVRADFDFLLALYVFFGFFDILAALRFAIHAIRPGDSPRFFFLKAFFVFFFMVC